MGYSRHVVLVTINQQEYFGFVVSFGMHPDAGALVHMHRTIPSKCDRSTPEARLNPS